MTPRQRRIAELIEAKKRIDKQIRLLDGDRQPEPEPPPTPAQIRADAERVRKYATNRYRDTTETLADRRQALLEDELLRTVRRPGVAA